MRLARDWLWVSVEKHDRLAWELFTAHEPIEHVFECAGNTLNVLRARKQQPIRLNHPPSMPAARIQTCPRFSVANACTPFESYLH